MLFRCTTRMKKSRRLELHQHRVGLRNRCLPQSATSASELLEQPLTPNPSPLSTGAMGVGQPSP